MIASPLMCWSLTFIARAFFLSQALTMTAKIVRPPSAIFLFFFF